MVERGQSPTKAKRVLSTEKNLADAPRLTFRIFAQRWVDETLFYRSGGYVAQTVRWLDAYFYPAIGDMQLDEVQPGDVLAIIKARADTAVTAERIRVIVQQIYNHAIRDLLVGHRIYLEPPLRTHRSESLIGGEKLVFRRRFQGVDEGPTPVEVSQKLVHALDLYFVAERSAYCRLDARGDIEDVIRVIRSKEADRQYDAFVTMLTKDLTQFMLVAGMSLVFFFDFTRFIQSNFGGWGDLGRKEFRAPDLFYNGGSGAGASYVNGRMICRPAITSDGLITEWKREQDGCDRKYASFKIHDRENNRHVEICCSPEHLSNCCQKSDLPWEISPAFFRPEVLHRFKADPEKFTMDDRSSGCRSAWYLKSYDINEAGQVHAYIGDLANLPYEEQIYWQSFNEWPKGSISKRAHQNDIFGEFSTEYDPLNCIKRKVKLLDGAAPSWWKPRDDKLADAARYPATDSVLEWGNEILALDQYLVEGFLEKPLRARIEERAGKPEPSWRSEVSDRREAFSIMLSMPTGTDARVVQQAAREFAKAELANHRYVMVLHIHQANPHVHISVRAEGRDGKRLNPRKDDLHRWRETFAEKLRDWGIEAEASSQATRGVSPRSLRGWERQPGAAVRTGKKRSEHKSGPAFRATRSGALQAWAEITKALAASPDPADRKLSTNIVDFVMQTEVAHAVQHHRAAQRQTELLGMGRQPERTAQPLRPEPNRGPDMSR